MSDATAAAIEALTLPCAGCGAPVDPLRAARVALFFERFHYFCSPECRDDFVPASATALREPVPIAASETIPLSSSGEAVFAPESAISTAASETAPRLRWTDGPLACAFGLCAGALGFTSARENLSWAAPLLAAFSCAFFIAAAARTPVPGLRERRLWLGAAPLAATSSALLLPWFEPASAPLAASIAGFVCAVASGSHALGIAAWRARDPERARVLDALGLRSDHLDDAARGVAGELKPGQEFVLEAGNRAPADAVVLAGRARVVPWWGARIAVVRQEGDALIAGARVVEGALRAVVRWAGDDRAWARLSLDPRRRADRHSAWAKLAVRASTTLAALAGALGMAIAVFADRHPLLGLSQGAAVFCTLANVALVERVALHVSRGVSRLLEGGLAIQTASALDRLSRVTRAVFCADGTLLSGDLEVASIEPSPGVTSAELLALVTGAFTGAPGSVPRALNRSAQAHQVRPDATRNPNFLPGLGVTAVASSGQALIVGTRALLLERRVSVASAEARIAELEALGRSVVLVALDTRWVGLLALQDNLAPGSRAAVQRLLDAGVEPVFLSGEARETCRALARTLGIDHVRPEVLPEARADEIRRLSQVGAPVAVIGRASVDDSALGAAQLSINIDPGAGPLERWDVDVVSGDVKDAALALALARELHENAEYTLWCSVGAAGAALLAIVIGLPVWVAPLIAFAGALPSWWPRRATLGRR